MEKEEMDHLLASIKEKKEADGLSLTEADLEGLRKLLNGEISIDEYMAL